MLKVDNIWKEYEGKPLLQGVSFAVSAGEVVCLLGPSGGGKSTLLHIIAGLETFDKGSITWKGKDIQEMPVHKRNFSLMFQDYALFPHRSVAQNIAFGLRMQGVKKSRIDIRVKELLTRVNLESFSERRVTDLSGGEMQRVALARALAPDPALLMLDEPLGSLDRTLSEHLATDLRKLLKQTDLPAIYVTHDQQEAFTIAGKILLMNEGRIVQEGTPHEVYQFPQSRWAAEFLGQQNLLEAKIQSLEPLKARTVLGEFQATSSSKLLKLNETITLLFRQSQSKLSPDNDHPNHLPGMVIDSIFVGEAYQTQVLLPNNQIFIFRLSQHIEAGEEINLYLPPEAIYCIQDGK